MFRKRDPLDPVATEAIWFVVRLATGILVIGIVILMVVRDWN